MGYVLMVKSLEEYVSQSQLTPYSRSSVSIKLSNKVNGPSIKTQVVHVTR